MGRLGKPCDAGGEVNAAGQQRIARRVRDPAQVAKGLELAPVAPSNIGDGAKAVERG